MLQFQTSDYCLLVWDSERTNVKNALESLKSYAYGGTDETRMTITVRPFDMGTDDDKAKKVLEEASEVRGAFQYEGAHSGSTLYEIADTITACVNLAHALGYTDADVQEKLNMVETGNEKKGRYHEQTAN